MTTLPGTPQEVEAPAEGAISMSIKPPGAEPVEEAVEGSTEASVEEAVDAPAESSTEAPAEDLAGEVEVVEDAAEAADPLAQFDALKADDPDEPEDKGAKMLAEFGPSKAAQAALEGFDEAGESPQGLGGKLTSRFLGTDVDDQLVLPRTGAIMTGAIVGGHAGSKVPILPGPAGFVVNPLTGAMMFSAAGVFVGTVAPETMLEIGEAFGVIEEGTRDEIGLSPEDLRGIAEMELVLDLATGGGFTILRLAGRPLARAFSGVTSAGMKIANAAAKQNIHLMPVQVGGSAIARGHVVVFGRFPILGGAVRKQGKKIEAQIEKAISGVAGRIAPLKAFSEISETIFSDATRLLKDTNKHFSDQYTALWKQAAELGVQVKPKNTISKAKEILRKIELETPVIFKNGKPGKGKPGKVLASVKQFLQKEILVLEGAISAPAVKGQAGFTGREAVEATKGSKFVIRQSFKEMDGLVTKIDQFLATLEPSQQKFAQALILQLRQAAQKDVVSNAKGLNSKVISQALRRLDAEFSKTMSSIFETATAKKFGSVKKRGLRGVGADSTTRTGVDELSRLVIRLKSPQSIDELEKLVTPRTFKLISAKVISDAIEVSLPSVNNEVMQFSSKFVTRLGINDKKSSTYKAVKKMLKKSDGVQMSDLEDIAQAAKVIESLEIPNLSSFVARRAGIGGIKSALTTFLPGAAIAGGVAKSMFSLPTLLAAIGFVGGSVGLTRVIADPLTVRFLRQVADKEVSRVVRKKAYVAILRLAALAATEALNGETKREEVAPGVFQKTEGEDPPFLSEDQRSAINENVDSIMDALQEQYNSFGKGETP